MDSGPCTSGKEVFQAEIACAGFELIEEIEVPRLQEDHFLLFERR